jgi:molecular chaperone HscB
MTSFDFATARQDFFSLFGLPRQQALDVVALEAKYRDVQGKVHPDKHAHLAPRDQRLAMQWATRVNEAYLTLKNPLLRARYLLELAGHDVRLETNTAMPAEFLMAQMELREAVAEARESGNDALLDSLHRQLRNEIRDAHASLQATLDAGQHAKAAALVRQLMFQEKLLEEINDALELLES